MRQSRSVLLLLPIRAGGLTYLESPQGSCFWARGLEKAHRPRSYENPLINMLTYCRGIGRNLMKKAEAFGMTTQYHNRSKLSEELSGGAKYVSFEELLMSSDVLSLNLPLNVSPIRASSRETRAIDDQTETNSSYHQHQGILKNEERRRNCEHSARSSNGRRRTCKGAQ